MIDEPSIVGIARAILLLVIMIWMALTMQKANTNI